MCSQKGVYDKREAAYLNQGCSCELLMFTSGPYNAGISLRGQTTASTSPPRVARQPHAQCLPCEARGRAPSRGLATPAASPRPARQALPPLRPRPQRCDPRRAAAAGQHVRPASAVAGRSAGARRRAGRARPRRRPRPRPRPRSPGRRRASPPRPRRPRPHGPAHAGALARTAPRLAAPASRWPPRCAPRAGTLPPKQGSRRSRCGARRRHSGWG